MLDYGLGFFDYGGQGRTLDLLLADHGAEGQPDCPEVLQQLPHFPPAQPVPAAQESDHGGQARTERPPRHPGRQVGAG
jgi:hypothetical protein